MSLADYIHAKPTIETTRLRLRPMTPADIPDLQAWLPAPSNYAYWGKGPGKADKHPELLFAKPPKPSKSFHLGLALKDSDNIIGDLWVYLIENDRMASVAIRVAETHRGRGYGTEAVSAMARFCFGHTELRRLWAQVDVRNIPSQRMLENAGFTREGLVRQGKMVNVWCDYFLYALLSTDLASPGNGSRHGKASTPCTKLPMPFPCPG